MSKEKRSQRTLKEEILVDKYLLKKMRRSS
jgi:hypothetical protein